MRFEDFAAACGLVLEPFQRRVARALCSDVEEVVVLLPRGNGKTTLLAAYALWHLLTVEDARTNFTAGTREQAALAFEHAVAFAHRLGDDRLHATRRELHFRPEPSKRRFTRYMRVRPGEAAALQGLDSTLAVIDEMHTATDESAYVAMHGSLKVAGGSCGSSRRRRPRPPVRWGGFVRAHSRSPGHDVAEPWSRLVGRTST